MKITYPQILFLFCLGIAFYALNVYTPIMHDDIAYLFKYGPPATIRPTDIPVNTIWDVFESQYYHYLDVNGRAPLHFLIQFFLLIGKSTFNFFNTAVFLGLILIIYQSVKSSALNAQEKFTLLTFISCCIWITSPFIGQTLLWLTGACNYLLGSFIVVVFLYYLQRDNSQSSYSKYNIIISFILSLFAGWTQESITIGVSVALFFYFLFHKSEINSKKIAMVLGFWIGTFLIIVSPGTFNRVHSEIAVTDLGFLDQIVLKILTAFNVLKIIYLNLVLMITLGLLNYFIKTSIITFIKKQSLYLLAVFFCFLLVVVIGMPEDRILFGTNILLVIINSTLFVLLLRGRSKLLLNSFSVIFLMTLSFSFYTAYTSCKKYDDLYSNVLSEIKQSKTGIIRIPTVDKSQYVSNTIEGIKDYNNGHNRVLGFYLNVSSITLLPSKVYDEFIPKNKICTLSNMMDTWNIPFYSNKNVDYLVVDLTKYNLGHVKPIVQFEYQLSGTGDLKAYQLFIRRILGTISVKKELRNAYSLKYEGKYYLLIDRKGRDLNMIDKIKIFDPLATKSNLLEISRN